MLGIFSKTQRTESYSAEIKRVFSEQPDNRNLRYKKVQGVLKNKVSCPMSVRLVGEAQHSHEGNLAERYDNRSVRRKCFAAATIWTEASLVASVSRAAESTLGLVVRLPLAIHRESSWHLKGESSYQLDRVRHAYQDVKNSMVYCGIAAVKVGKPDYAAERVDEDIQAYIHRADRKWEHGVQFREAKRVKRARDKLIRQARRKNLPPPDFSQVTFAKEEKGSA